jgi:hypothetical protein
MSGLRRRLAERLDFFGGVRLGADRNQEHRLHELADIEIGRRVRNLAQ